MGFGASDKPVLQYTIELWAELIDDFLAEFAAGTPPVVVGNSIGSLNCLAAAALAADRQQQLAGVVLLNSAGAMNNKVWYLCECRGLLAWWPSKPFCACGPSMTLRAHGWSLARLTLNTPQSKYSAVVCCHAPLNSIPCCIDTTGSCLCNICLCRLSQALQRTMYATQCCFSPCAGCCERLAHRPGMATAYAH